VLLKLGRKRSRLTKRFHSFSLRLFWNERLNKLALRMKHIAWIFSGFQTHSDRGGFGTEIVRSGAGTDWEGSRGGLEVWWAGAAKISRIPAGQERSKNFNRCSTLKLCQQGCSRAGTRSHIFFIVTWLEHMYFYLDFLCVTSDVAKWTNDKLSLAYSFSIFV